ncbi:Gamma-interferon-inducible lysosomal thiol reductase [Heracleum sosnowskyi]|uniref:Gamma-interferon-inducible lysosomal thiol reductase n=1 Tax=Heracleum sosnowskyi TaxID=360622 RepID=A0AAD8MAF0_9APIA|nr:Gamma-interferon-inducible lysosomal thiol reductase [Heracleum sosnowskyi]
MASSKLVFPFFLFMSLFIFHSDAAPYNYTKVNVSLYYESLCPFCGNFIVNQLGKVFETDLISIVNLRLIPWGNAHRVTNITWTCQHGPDECLINTVEACAVNLWPDPKVHFKLIQCIERLTLGGKQNLWRSCLGEQHLNQELMNHCYNSTTGNDLQLRAAYETERLQPPHRFVPWVIVNNKTLEQDYQNYITHICKAYTGPNRPGTCSLPPEIFPSNIEPSVSQVCYTRKTGNSFAPQEEKAGSAKILGRKKTQSWFMSWIHKN